MPRNAALSDLGFEEIEKGLDDVCPADFGFLSLVFLKTDSEST